MNASITTAGQGIPGRLLSLVRGSRCTLLVATVSLVITSFSSNADWATWERSDPFGIQLWLSHLSHWSGGHLLWDLMMFLVLGAVLETMSRRLLIHLLLTAPPIIILATLLMEPHVSYRGLSGLDCALYTAVITTACFQKRINAKVALGFLILVIGKCLFEILSGRTLFVSDLPIGITAVPWAHLSGAICGIALAMMDRPGLFFCNGSAIGGSSPARRVMSPSPM